METNWNKLIERYLNNELSAEGKEAFETELAQNQDLQTEFELHTLTREVIQRNAFRDLVKQSGKWYSLKKKLVLLATLIVATVILLVAIKFSLNSSDETNEKFKEVKTSKIEHSEKENTIVEDIISEKNVVLQFLKNNRIKQVSLLSDYDKYLAFDNIQPQYFEYLGESDVFLSKTGVLLSLTEKSFLLNGKPYTGNALIQWQEAQTASDFAKAGLSTKADDRLLETQGMFSLNAFTPDGQKLELSKEGAYIQVPVNEVKEGMKLFEGVAQTNGDVNWIEPVELERLPKQKSMNEMDLYPNGYEPKLNELKWYTEKTKRDSLYLSFEQNRTNAIISQSQSVVAEMIGSDSFKSRRSLKSLIKEPIKIKAPNISFNFSVEYLQNNEAYIVASTTIKDGWYIDANKESESTTRMRFTTNSSFEVIGDLVDENQKVKIAQDVVGITKTAIFKQKIKVISKTNFTINGVLIFSEFGKADKIKFNETPLNVFIKPPKEEQKTIPPSKVLAIWNTKFDNTILATQDFEDRMKLIHETCDEAVLKVYTGNLNEAIWKLDERVVAMGYPQFKEFANQRVGKLKIDDTHQKNLADFYKKAVNSIREFGQKNYEEALRKEQKWDNELQSERDQEVVRSGMRKATNFQEEYNFNHKNVSKQLGFKAGFRMTTNIVNIDKYVREATIARKTTEIVNPFTGKVGKITYNPMSVKVNNASQYDKLYIYLFSKEVNSYQRLDFENGTLNYSLNSDMNYTAAIIGLNGSGFYYHEIKNLNAENLGSISLENISEKEFDKRINALNDKRTEQPMSLSEELQWLFKEKANYEVQKQRKKDVEFRKEIRPMVFPCDNSVESFY